MQRADILTDLKTHGFALIEADSGAPFRDIEEVAAWVGEWPESVDQDLVGDRVMTLRYDGARSSSTGRQAYFTCDAFPLHTDLAYIPVPPRWIVMQCVHPSREPQGMTTLADCNSVTRRLTERDIETLARSCFRFAYPPGCRRGFSEPEPVLKPVADGYRVRYRYDILDFPADAKQALLAFQSALEEMEFRIGLARGDTLIIDNYRLVHGRTAFDPVQSAGRTLLRTYAWM